MNVTYTLKDGSKLYGYFWDDFYNDKETYHEMEVYSTNRRIAETKHEVLKDEKGKFFVYNNEKIYVKDFDYLSIPLLIEKINCGIGHDDNWFVSDNMVLTSLMKQPLDFGIIINDEINPETAEPIIFIPMMDDRDNFRTWYYKISFMPADASLYGNITNKRYYFSSFCSLLKCGEIKLIELDK